MLRLSLFFMDWEGIDSLISLADFGTTVAILAANTYVGLKAHYWTVMTWIVVVGSTPVMAYSYFSTPDFTILFGTMTFCPSIYCQILVYGVSSAGQGYHSSLFYTTTVDPFNIWLDAVDATFCDGDNSLPNSNGSGSCSISAVKPPNVVSISYGFNEAESTMADATRQ
jgi:hypothetical protein